MVQIHSHHSLTGIASSVFCALLALMFTSTATAVNVRLEISSREIYVDVPFSLSIIIEDANGVTPEVDFPDVPELDIVSGPSQSSSSFTQIINGRMTQSESITLSYQAMTRNEGAVTIPAIMITLDNQIYYTRPVELSAIRSVSGDLIFARVLASRDTYYLGETFPLTLEIWLRPYVDQQYNIRLDKQNMWNTLSSRASSFGIFGEEDRNITVRESQQRDDEGTLSTYYTYSIETLITPRQAGGIHLEDIRIIANYPTQLRRRQSFFEDRLEVAESRPIVCPVEPTTIQIVSPPAEGQPEIFAGAVGQFDIDVTAQPTEASVGDPITLTISISDLTREGSRLEDLQPPPLDRIDTLTNDFRIPSDPLAGMVEGQLKRFTQTIRPLHDRVQEVPPIPFAYFDPVEEQYHVVNANSIPLQISAASQMALSDVVEANGSLTEQPQTELTEVAGGVMANYTDLEILLAQQQTKIPQMLVACLLVAPPFIFLGFLTLQFRMRRLQGDPSHMRYRNAFRQAKQQLHHAQSQSKQHHAEMTGAVVRRYIADRCRLKSSSITTEEAIQQLRKRGVNSELVKRIEQLLGSCEQLTFAGHVSEQNPHQIAEALSCLKKLERET